MMEGDKFENHAEHILKKIMHRKNPNSADVEKLADYLKANFSGSSVSTDGMAAVEKKNVGRPIADVDDDEVHKFIKDEIERDPNFSETKLKKKVADKFGISATKALDFVKPSSFVPKLMRTNGLKSLVRRYDKK